jgi:hypothetical protein
MVEPSNLGKSTSAFAHYVRYLLSDLKIPSQIYARQRTISRWWDKFLTT